MTNKEQMMSLKQQLILLAVACMALTLLFGGVLSIAVNLTLEQLEDQPDLMVPGVAPAPGE